MVRELERPPDKVLAFSSLMPLLDGGDDAASEAYACAMHPEVTATEAGTCPKCGMKLVPVQAPTLYVCPMHPEATIGSTTPDGSATSDSWVQDRRPLASCDCRFASLCDR